MSEYSFIINPSNHIKRGGKYKRLIVDEALMFHAGEILFAVALVQAPEVILIGDTNQIPYINHKRLRLTRNSAKNQNFVD